MMFSDEQLQSYLAGTLSPSDAAEIEERVAQDQDLEARLHAFDYARSTPLRAGFEQVPNADRLQDLEALVLNKDVDTAAEVKQARWAWPLVSAAAAFAAAAVLFAGPFNKTDPSWQDQVAVYQTLYVAETLSSTMPNAEDISAQLLRSEQALGRTLPKDVVTDLNGMDLVRAQVLGFDGAPLIQMAYLSDKGVPVALCAIRLASPATDQPIYETLSGLPVVHWSDGSFGYMIVGDIERDILMDIANTVSRSL